MMLSRNLAKSQRIPHLRPLRPPSRTPFLQPRLFTQKSQLLIISRNASRPQLPYLSQPTRFRQQPFLNYQISRLLSTETREHFIAQAWLTVKWLAIVFAFMFLGSVTWAGIQMEVAERENPTPKEWRFWTRQALRSAREEMDVVKDKKRPMIDWAKVGGLMQEALRRLEDPEYDGKELKAPGAAAEDEQAESILIPGIGKAGYDITAKSYEWRTCYFEVLMGCAVAAEHLDGMVVDVTRRWVFPATMVVGPSNPDPRPVPSYMWNGIAPLEENCEPAFEQPEVYYVRILTGEGFTTKQKLQAAEGYANWLDFKGLKSSAEEMYRWGLDITKAALPLPSDVIIDEKTDVLKAEAGKEATSNLLRASTDLAVHHARTGNIAAALPMFVSILRARRNAPISRDPLFSGAEEEDPQGPKTDIGQAMSFLGRIMKAPQFPHPPPTGDEPFTRSSSAPSCQESELMLYIGEILYANDPNQQSQEGLGWTRQAVRIAEKNLGKMSSAVTEEGEKCKQCLITGVQNWEVMLQQLATRQTSTAAREGGRTAGWFEWRGWFGRDGGVKGQVLDEAAAGMLEEEMKIVEKLKARLLRELIEDEEGSGPKRSLMGWTG